METADKNDQINPTIFKIMIHVFWDVLVHCWAVVPDVFKDHNTFILSITQSQKIFFPECLMLR
jgi:hypothetical protein